jgi:hypothetical protein
MHGGKAKYDIRIDRGTPFGNPFDHSKLGITRVECVRRYKEWFYKRLTDEAFRDRVLSLKNKILGCWCVPDLCHGMVIIEYLEGIPYEKKEKNSSTNFENIGLV